MEKLIDILKGKKQIVALFAMWILSTLTAESCHPGYIAAVAIVAMLCQTYLDLKGEKHEKSIIDVNGADTSGGV